VALSSYLVIFVRHERDGFALKISEFDKSYIIEILCLICVDDSSLILLFPLLYFQSIISV
jgi:hypothetical protein